MNQETQNYYKVVAKCGHVGKRNYVPIVFAVKAENGKDASKKVRRFPRVKHNHKDAILYCQKITLEEFLQINEINNNDPYLKCQNKQEQKRTCDLNDRLEKDFHYVERIYSREERLQRVNYKLTKYKIIRNFDDVEDTYDYVY